MTAHQTMNTKIKFPYSVDGDLLFDKDIERLKRELSKYKIAEQARKLDEIREKDLREKNPAVKDAWEKYQLMLRIFWNE